LHEKQSLIKSVESIEGSIEKVVRGGGKVITPKMAIGQYGVIRHFEDREGNRIGLHSLQSTEGVRSDVC
jgi:predicted enzyme related to lactoylglutathione lyase